MLGGGGEGRKRVRCAMLSFLVIFRVYNFSI